MPFPELDKFFSDPKHEKEREFMRGVVTRLIKEEVEKKRKETPDEENLFDALFGGK